MINKQFLLVLFILFSFHNVFGLCENNYQIIETREGTENITIKKYCDFGCANGLGICRPPEFLTTAGVILFGFISFLLFQTLNYPFTVISATFLLIITVPLAVTEYFTGVSRLLLILLSFVYVVFIIYDHLKSKRY